MIVKVCKDFGNGEGSKSPKINRLLTENLEAIVLYKQHYKGEPIVFSEEILTNYDLMWKDKPGNQIAERRPNEIEESPRVVEDQEDETPSKFYFLLRSLANLLELRKRA